ncbi:MAG: CDP-alcohol phosphatidyltransferase family protein [Eubacterium sp.]|nr:CDP-alcohol phosphatidyltransferase family protein [Eubacterium sp.]
MGKRPKSEYFTIPNIMGYFRIALVPVYLVLFYMAHEHIIPYYWPAYVVIAISGLTDFFDGFIARKFNQVTDFGKMLDPIADKITLGSIILSLCYAMPLAIIPMMGLYILKEGYMAIAGTMLMKRGYKIKGAEFHGKVCTFATYVVMIVVLLYIAGQDTYLSWLDVKFIYALVSVNMVIMIYSLIRYIIMYTKLFRSLEQS